MARVAQLTVRTNQMNSTALRMPSEHALRLWLEAEVGGGCAHAGGAAPVAEGVPSTLDGSAPVAEGASPAAAGRWVVAGWVSDRYGAYGLVACALCRAERGAVVVECLNMSCRVLHRGVEHAILRRVAQDAAACGAPLVLLALIPTPVEGQGNARMQRFVARLRLWHDTHDAELPSHGEPPAAPTGHPPSQVVVGRGTVAPAVPLVTSRLLQLELDATEDDAEEDEDGAARHGAETEQHDAPAPAMASGAAAGDHATQGPGVGGGGGEGLSDAARPGAGGAEREPSVAWEALLDEVMQMGDRLRGIW